MTTPKRYKAAQLIGALLLIFGVAAIAGTGDWSWIWTALLGAAVYAAGRLLAWWHCG